MKLHAAMLAFCMMGMATPALAKAKTSGAEAEITVTGPDGASARYRFNPDGRFEMLGQDGAHLNGAWTLDEGRLSLDDDGVDADEDDLEIEAGSVSFRIG